MAVNKTPNLGLHDWLGTEYVKREEIVENFRKIDNEFGASGRVGDLSNKIGILFEKAYDVRKLGIYPDGVTDWRANGKLDAALRFSRDNKIPIYFPPGYYRCALDNYYSDVTCIFAEGAEFAGTIHAAINNDPNNPSSMRPKNVKFLGTVTSYERVGTYNCDDVFIERIRIKSDPTKSLGGIKSAGVHFYLDTRNLHVNEIIVDDVQSDKDYAVGIDGNATFEPVNVTIGLIHVKDSETNGLYLCGKNHYIGKVIIEGYGAGSQTRPLPNTTAQESAIIKGVWTNRTYDCYIDSVIVNQKTGTRTNAGDAVYVDEGEISFGKVVTTDASGNGFTILAAEEPTAKVNELEIRNPKVRGIKIINGSLFAKRIRVKGALDRGIYVEANKKIYADEIFLDGNAIDQLYLNTGARINAKFIEVTNHYNTSYNAVTFNATGYSWIGELSVVNPTKGQAGGLYINNASNLTIDRIRIFNAGVSGNANLSAVRIEYSSNIRILSGEIKAGNGQGLRLVSLTDCSFNGLVIDGHDTNVAGATLTNVGFMNCTSKNATTSLSNIPTGTVQTFNCVGMTA
jgi:hypothetical protein